MRTDYGDPVAEACEQLPGYIATLEDLVGELPCPPGGPRRMLARPAHSPEPYRQAGQHLMTILERLCRLEASVRLETQGHPGRRRPLTSEAIADILTQLPKLAAGLDEPGYRETAWHLWWCVRHAQAVRDIDEVRRWRPLPPTRECPYCGTSWLKVDMDTGRDGGVVACFSTACPGDGSGVRATGTMGTDSRGVPGITWADGRFQPGT